MKFSVLKLVKLVLLGAHMIYFIHLHHVTSRIAVFGQRLDMTLLFWGTVLFYAFAEDGTRDRYTTVQQMQPAQQAAGKTCPM